MILLLLACSRAITALRKMRGWYGRITCARAGDAASTAHERARAKAKDEARSMDAAETTARARSVGVRSGHGCAEGSELTEMR